MKLLNKIRSLMSRDPDFAPPPITLVPAGFCVGDSRFEWDSVQQIDAYKIDLVTTDEIRFDLTFPADLTFTVAEDQAGFSEFVAELTERFDGVSDWESRVIQPAFASNHSVLYRRT